VRYGCVLPQQALGTDPGAIAAWARAVEGLGFSYLDAFDHVLGADVAGRPGWPGPYTVDHAFHEPLVLYGFLAAHVGIELATGVLVLPQRQTALVAKQAAEVDLLTGGRFRLGVGIGWNPVEHEALGSDFATRADRYEEQVALLRRLWTEPVVHHAGAHHRIDGAGLRPHPVQQPIPIWLGGGTSPAVLDRVGRIGDGWIAHDPRPAAGFAAAVARIRSAADRAGRDPDGIGLQGRIDLHGPPDPDRYQRALDAWHAAGVDHLSIHVRPGGDLAAHLDALSAVADTTPDLHPPIPGKEPRARL
jgi:probable F420-dependent oxidoreductase